MQSMHFSGERGLTLPVKAKKFIRQNAWPSVFAEFISRVRMTIDFFSRN